MAPAPGGIYLYCIIAESNERNFGPIGIGGQEAPVVTITRGGLSAVGSAASAEKYPPSRANLLAHEGVIAKVLQEYASVLPIRFGTVAGSAEEIRELLRRRDAELRRVLHEMAGKVEVGVQVFWRQMQQIWLEVTREEEGIRKLRDKVFGKEAAAASQEEKIRLGERAQQALAKKKEKEAQALLKNLRQVSVDCRENQIYLDHMVLNAAFLVDRTWEKEFDNCLAELDARDAERYQFKRSEATAPFDFVHIQLT